MDELSFEELLGIYGGTGYTPPVFVINGTSTVAFTPNKTGLDGNPTRGEVPSTDPFGDLDYYGRPFKKKTDNNHTPAPTPNQTTADGRAGYNSGSASGSGTDSGGYAY